MVLTYTVLQHKKETSTSNKFTAVLTLYVGIRTGNYIFHLILVVSIFPFKTVSDLQLNLGEWLAKI